MDTGVEAEEQRPSTTSKGKGERSGERRERRCGGP